LADSWEMGVTVPAQASIVAAKNNTTSLKGFIFGSFHNCLTGVKLPDRMRLSSFHPHRALAR